MNPLEIILEEFESINKTGSPFSGFSLMLADSTMTVTNLPCTLFITGTKKKNGDAQKACNR